jgi:hypothetical protein
MAEKSSEEGWRGRVGKMADEEFVAFLAGNRTSGGTAAYSCVLTTRRHITIACW